MIVWQCDLRHHHNLFWWLLRESFSFRILAMQLRAKLYSASFQLVAGHPVLDFVNTLDWRFRSSGSEELLNHYADLLRFSEHSGLMTPLEVRKLATGDLARKKRILSSTKKLRECLASILYAIAAGQAPQIEDVRTLSGFARTVRETEDLEWRASRLQWKANKIRTNALDTPFRKLASAALDLLTSEELNKLSVCSNPECRWLFLDGSKNKGRRWCDMKLCGNRIKARRYRRRQRSAASQ
jgi:predicted RNA-binding Zn ribbon-like protein